MSKSHLFILSNVLFLFFISDFCVAQDEFQLVNIVKQKGPVAYRDPIGAVSPDGKLVAFSDSRRLEIQSITGGISTKLANNGSIIRYFTWTPNGNLITSELGGPRKTWYTYNIQANTSKPLWPDKEAFIVIKPDGTKTEISRHNLRELTWSLDGKHIAGSANLNGRTAVIEFEAGGNNPKVVSDFEHVTSLQWNPNLSCWAGIVIKDDERYIQLDLGNPKAQKISGNIYGKIAFTNDGKSMYYASGNDNKILELWKQNLETNQKQQLTNFSKDTYAPSISKDGKVLFKLKDYRISIATVSGQGGPSTTLTGFQSEIPYWHPDGKRVAFTYGNWRTVMDDAKYPDIDQNLGWAYVNRESPAKQPDTIIRASYSEDQGMCWSPNLKWIAFHTHADKTDDLWIMPVSGDKMEQPLTKGGYETGWPRWSKDGKWIVSTTGTKQGEKMGLIIVGIDQDKGEITSPQKLISPIGLENGSFTDVQWTSDSKSLVVEYVVDDNRKEIWCIPIDGGKGKLIYSFNSDQLYSGIGLSSNDQWIAYIAPDDQGYYQLYKVSFNGKQLKQLTFDPTDKAHPVFSPVEDKIAFSVFSYKVIFWQLDN
ncbi:hypothetical protein [uncultured Psychroserpens sp.]|uniref:hypothetical protein n=1 Tax=uncultured Psychroserpens sp. TaxID=255436 RepID=UPI0026300A8B|nr:hypothetical protein [uncultured Psychroserpens sp.]